MSCTIDFEKEWELRHQGAESRLYFGLHSNNRCVIKHRFSKEYRHILLDKKLTKERTKRERRMIEKVKAKSKLLSTYMPQVVWSNESVILMTEITDCITLFDFIEQEPTLALEVARLIGHCVAELHNIGIIHGDLTTSNLLLIYKENKDLTCGENISVGPLKKFKLETDLGSKCVVVPIDFGLSTGSYHPEERAVDLYVLERALLSAHFGDSQYFDLVFESYLEHIDVKTCEPGGKEKIIERLREVRLRGRKSDYANSEEA